MPNVAEPFVCKCCLGPVDQYRYCFGCNRLLPGAPDQLRNVVVPMTSAPNPSPWYSRLVRYKTADSASSEMLGAMVDWYLEQHGEELDLLLGGHRTFVTIVPSKRGRRYEDQALRLLLKDFAGIGDDVRPTLDCVAPTVYARQKYAPDVFRLRPDAPDMTGARILLVEDTWVSGATCLSAAGALLRAGAASVAIAPIAREVNLSYTAADHPYLVAAQREANRGAWPR